MKHIQSLKSICIEALVKNSLFYAKAIDATSNLSLPLKRKLLEEKTIDDKDKEELIINRKMAHEEQPTVARRREDILSAIDIALHQSMVGIINRGWGI